MSSEISEPSGPNEKQQHDYLFKTMKMYQDSAKAFVSLATGLLVLTVTFREKVFGEKSVFGRIQGGTHWENGFLFVAWLFLVVAVIGGTFYQYLAVKHVEVSLFERASVFVPAPLKRYVSQPGLIYGLMLAAFSLGALFFFIYAAIQLFR